MSRNQGLHVGRLRAGSHEPVVAEFGAVGTHRRLEERREDHAGESEHDSGGGKDPGWQFAHEEHDRSPPRVEGQDVAEPQRCVCDSDGEEQRETPQAEPHHPSILGCSSLSEVVDANAEQQ